jgi:23S rRNA (adenine2503-C2)-methyltransferase
MKQNIIGIPREELGAKLEEIGLEKFRLKQIWQWIYFHGVTDFERMTNISKPQRQIIADNFYIGRPQVSRDLKSFDGTRKWLVKFEDGNEVETVHIPEEDRGALCISSQVGCSLTCTFCHTGTQKMVRNLTAADIIGQLMIARDAIGEWPSPSEDRMISNIVMMGMGEPLLNYENVKTALKIVMDGEGIKLSKRRITLSTSGIVPLIKECSKDLGVNLAISLHAVRNELRDEIVPINQKWPIEELLAACRGYYGKDQSFRQITFEYVMLKGINDSLADAKELVRLLKGMPAKVNLIPFNPWPGSNYECSSPTQIQAFSQLIFDAGLAAPIRTPRGQDIMAACGQLKSASEKIKSASSAA